MKIADRDIGNGAPSLIIAEIGINHNGNMELAVEMIDAAAQAGADAVKFQNFRVDDFITDRELTWSYPNPDGTTTTETQYDMFKRVELSGQQLKQLAEACAEAGVMFTSTPTSAATLAELVNAGAPVLKNGSDFLGHIPLVRAMGRTGLPTILSTGMATEQDVADAVTAFRSSGGKDLILLACTSDYPTAPENVNLRKINSLAEHFECPVGFSDHTIGVHAATAAVALGACIVEKHFTLDKTLVGPDHYMSADPKEMAELVNAVRYVEQALGNGEVVPDEKNASTEYRLSAKANHDIARGKLVTENDVCFHRPGDGISPIEMERLFGRPLLVDKAAGEKFDRGDFG